MTEPHRPARPWCLPCRGDDGTVTFAQFLGIACEWHWGILEESDQQALTDAVRRRHPRGGRVRSVLAQIWVLRGDLRRGGNTVEKTWHRDREVFRGEQGHD